MVAGEGCELCQGLAKCGRERERAREKRILLPLPRTSRERRRSTMLFTTTPCCALFFHEQCIEMAPFYTKHVVLFKRK